MKGKGYHRDLPATIQMQPKINSNCLNATKKEWGCSKPRLAAAGWVDPRWHSLLLFLMLFTYQLPHIIIIFLALGCATPRTRFLRPYRFLSYLHFPKMGMAKPSVATSAAGSLAFAGVSLYLKDGCFLNRLMYSSSNWTTLSASV